MKVESERECVRRVLIPPRYLIEAFKFPPGFKAMAVNWLPEFNSFQLTVECPSEERYAVKEGAEIPIMAAVFHTDGKGEILKAEWEDQ